MGFKEIENQEFKREKKWIDTLNQQLKNQEYENAGPAAYVNKLGLGYLDLNSRMLQMGKEKILAEEIRDIMKTFLWLSLRLL